MSKNHFQSKVEPINDQILNAAQLKRDTKSFQKSAGSKLEDGQLKGLVDERSVQIRAFEIHTEKGGSALDNWLEAEQILKSNDTTVSSFISEGNPNTQK